MLLDRLRRSTAGWAAKILIGFLTLSFALWGIGDIIGPGSGRVLAEVGEAEIVSQSFERRFRRRLDEIRRQTGQGFTYEEARAAGLDKAFLQILVNQTAITEEARDLGLRAADAAIAQEIRSDPFFLDPFGAFDRTAYEQALALSGTRASEFADERRAIHVRFQLGSILASGVSVPSALSEALWLSENERRRVDYILLPPGSVEIGKEPDDEALEVFMRRNPGFFLRPERRDVSMIVLDPEAMGSLFEATESEKQAAYELRRARFSTPERRRTDQIVFGDRQEAEEARERIENGESFEAIAKERELTEEDIELGLLGRGDYLSPEMGNAAFSLEKGEVSDVVEGPLGPLLLRVREIVLGEEKSYEEVRDRLGKELAQEKARGEIYALHDLIEDDRAGGASLEETATRLDLPFFRLERIGQDGSGLEEEEREALALTREGLALAFSSGLREETEAGQTRNGGYYWLEVEKIEEGGILSLEEAREEAVQEWKKEERRALLEKRAQELALRGRDGESLDVLAKGLGRAPVSSGLMGRFFSNEVFSREAVRGIFRAPAGTFLSAPVSAGEGYVLMRVTDIRAAPSQENKESIEAGDRLVKEAMTEEVITQFLTDAEARQGVRIYEDALAVLGSGSQ